MKTDDENLKNEEQEEEVVEELANPDCPKCKGNGECNYLDMSYYSQANGFDYTKTNRGPCTDCRPIAWRAWAGKEGIYWMSGIQTSIFF